MSAARRPSLPESATEILASLAQHRVLSTAQVAAIHFPARTRRRAQQALGALEAAGLARHAQRRTSPRRVWHVSEEGARAAEREGLLAESPPILDAVGVTGHLCEHTLAVNEAAIAFLRCARERGDELTPLSWHHEVAEPLSVGRGRRRRMLLADALLTYLRAGQGRVQVEQRFLEVDRATLSIEALAAELARYAELLAATGPDGEALWRERYPSFPPVIAVLGGAPRALLERRREVALALLRSDPRMSRAPGLSVRICLAEDLSERGPFAPIYAELGSPGERVGWLDEGGEES